MNRSTTRKHRTVLTLLAAVLSATAVPMVAPSTAEAAAGGEACIVLAPNDVDPDGRGPRAPMGHSGWAFRHGITNTWTYGATEGMTGKPQATFITTGSWGQMLHNFKTRNTGTRRYLKYRCLSTPSANVGKADLAASRSAHDGYDLFRNNCLTKSVDIFHAYSPWLNSTRHLPNPRIRGISLPPNYYYNNLLPKARWSPSRNL
ncbi:Tat pathway signal protein [Streptomyces sp. AK02-04a]|uniref:Tat pathway signal protein n=1 Tax=Streptomyces sp. AK02-04a TaxID=3028649 RepID=UPI0029B4F5CA|nr:Tat pathway signal protein [Streptomyces sp. AK02-04a]MDX3763574.1 Tat pathway signal protein [Streptomyces sp. AK02-04a]